MSAGDLSHRIGPSGADEIGRVAEAFNQMTESLQRTLREKASRESLAAMGEFAASLAHEVRNPLTAVKIDLQSLQERLADNEALNAPLRRVLEEIERPLLSICLGATRGNQIRAAELLGLNRNTLRSRIKALNIQVYKTPAP